MKEAFQFPSQRFAVYPPPVSYTQIVMKFSLKLHKSQHIYSMDRAVFNLVYLSML